MINRETLIDVLKNGSDYDDFVLVRNNFDNGSGGIQVWSPSGVEAGKDLLKAASEDN